MLTHTDTHTETRILYFKNDAGVRLRLTAVVYYPLSEVAAYLQEWHTVVEAQPANCMETMQHVEWYFFTCSVSIASLRGLRLNAGWWTESSVPGPHEWGHLVNLNIEPWIVSISCNVSDVTSLQWVLEYMVLALITSDMTILRIHNLRGYIYSYNELHQIHIRVYLAGSCSSGFFFFIPPLQCMRLVISWFLHQAQPGCTLLRHCPEPTSGNAVAEDPALCAQHLGCSSRRVEHDIYVNLRANLFKRHFSPKIPCTGASEHVPTTRAQ